ncbi:DJ-1/PfpI family protein [Spirosoma sp. BT702]|uniref:DJ-1/PfpI family protein n=1 Tax=Spirosoma profusum TaxID=2771354 RepID=A0A926Y0N2_9BACT|nr:DJ-1/PfpI family protein [Spirosoma profusum]MBD2701343.1 DJ-1/PfpI family protein [Spirosoma profusum]
MDRPIKFVFLILPNVHLMDLAGPDQTIHEAIDYGASFIIEYCGIDAEVQSSAGLHMKKPLHFSQINLSAGDYLLIPGSSVTYLLSPEFARNQSLFDWIRQCHQQQIRLVSICAGAFVLAQCGLLNGIACTTHFKQTRTLQAMYPLANVRENILFVEENNIYTSAGIASGIDLLLYIIERHKGGYFTHKVARELVIYNRRDGSNQQISVLLQFRNHIHTGIHRAQDYIIEHIYQRHNLGALAEIANMSERNFTRIFKKETGITATYYINLIRRELIDKFLNHKDLTLTQIAQKVGLMSEKQVRRILKSVDT